MSIEQDKPWITAKEAARILRVSERQVGNYAKRGDLRVVRRGRNVRYSSEDVQRLAQTLEETTIRPELPATRQEVNEQLIRFVQAQAENQQDVVARLERIEQRLNEPPKLPERRGPSWTTIAALALVLAIVVIALVIVMRFL